MTPFTLSATTITGTGVRNRSGEDVGELKDLMIDLNSGRIAYVVLSFGGFLGLGNKLFAIPWEAFEIDTEDEKFILDVDKEALENAPGFDQHNWPRAADTQFVDSVYEFYETRPYWST
jgi:sporulation protein YlmC with PRC-barrel domain